MCYCDYDPVEMYEGAPVRARKAHKCSECSSTIEVGEVYLSATYFHEGAFTTYKRCARCEVVWNHIHRHEKCACIAFGGLADHISEGCGWGSKDAAVIISAYQRDHRIGRPSMVRHYLRHRVEVRSARNRRWERPDYHSKRQALLDKYYQRKYARQDLK